MKSDIHPKYFENAKVGCACGNTFTVGSTLPELYVEICSNCHPFYTGKQKLVDTAKRVEKYQTRAGKQKDASTKRLGKKVKKARSRAMKVDESKKTSEKNK